MAEPALARLTFTYRDYLAWDDDKRWELIDGEPFAMSPAPSRDHQAVVGGLFVQLANFLEGKRCRPFVAPLDVRLPENDEADQDIETVVQPDVLVVCDPEKLDHAGVRGAPDLIVEVASDRSRKSDREVKRALYERHGVQEYWQIDPRDRFLLALFLDPATGRYQEFHRGLAQGLSPSRVLAGFSFDWERVFA